MLLEETSDGTLVERVPNGEVAFAWVDEDGSDEAETKGGVEVG